MSDQSDRDDDLSLNVAGTPSEQDSGKSEPDQDVEGNFFDLEAEESDDYEGYEDDYGRHFEPCSFPQFSRLPPELRAMIWEAVDPDLKSKARVLDFIAIKDGVLDLQESATLAQQTAPARALLATYRESRRLALGYYPDTIQLRHGRGEVRFNSANDIILLRLPYSLRDSDMHGFRRWCSKAKYLAFDNGLESYPTPRHLSALRDPPEGLETIFFCFDATTLGHRILDWSVSESSKQFYVETFEEKPGLGEDVKELYCWPDTTLYTDFLDQVGSDYMLKFPDMSAIGSIPVWPMAQYSSENGLMLYQKAKRYHERNKGREDGSASPHESSEGESFYESEPDDYAIDGFVVGSSSEESEEASDAEDDGVDVDYEDSVQRDVYEEVDYFDGFDGMPGSSDYEDPVPQYDVYEEDGQFDLEVDDFNGFSPLQNYNDNDGAVSPIDVHPRASKRARFVVSDSEGDEDGSGADAGSGIEGSRRLRKRARVIVSDSEEGEDDENNHSERRKLPMYALDSDSDEDEDGDDDANEGTEEEEEDEEEPRASKPVSLLARLRQFRSDVPVSPEGESPISSEEHGGERYEDEDERRFSDAEFPESAEEEDEQDG